MERRHFRGFPVTAYTHADYFSKSLADADPDIFKGIQGELGRQQEQIELIASENIVSKAVLDAQGSVLTNKYAEGYPGRRYYGGCEFVDITEDLARERAKELFGAAFANVQPHSGAQANQAVFFTLLQPGDTFLGMDLACGGHLTPEASHSRSRNLGLLPEQSPPEPSYRSRRLRAPLLPRG